MLDDGRFGGGSHGVTSRPVAASMTQSARRTRAGSHPVPFCKPGAGSVTHPGLTRNDWLPTPVPWRRSTHPTSRPGVWPSLDRVRATGERVVILKRGRPCRPQGRVKGDYPQFELKGAVTVIGDITGPVALEESWDSLKR